MKKQNVLIVILFVSAVALSILCFGPAKSDAAFAVKDRDYQLITAANQQGGETVYVVDNRTGKMAVFTYDIRQRVLRPRQVRPVADAFLQ